MTSLNQIPPPAAPASHDDDDEDTVNLRRQADAVRANLLEKVGELDHRRHEALDVRHQLQTHLGPIVVVGAVAAVATAAGIALLVHRASTAEQRHREARVSMVKRLWEHPERVARGREGPSALWPVGGGLMLLSLAARTLLRV